MALPKRKHSHKRTAQGRTHWVTKMPELTPTKNVTGEPYNLRHNASPDGYYKGRRLPGFKDKE